MDNRSWCVPLILVLLLLIFQGCAAAVIMSDVKTEKTPAAAGAQIKQEPLLDSGAIVVRAKRLTRLERKKKEAIRINNRDTYAVLFGTAGALTAYTAMNVYYASRNEQGNPLVTFCAVGAAAYAVTAIANLIYDLFDAKLK